MDFDFSQKVIAVSGDGGFVQGKAWGRLGFVDRAWFRGDGLATILVIGSLYVKNIEKATAD